jgi:two-component system alkaline phosphatase synthesis response regulator PhoP
MSAHRILVVEDEQNLAQTLLLNLRLEGYQTTHASTGNQVLSIISAGLDEIDLVLLDVMLPDADGYSLCRRMKEKRPGLPVFFLTARSAKVDKLEGLSLGADDYLTKPFDLDELLLRVANLLKRTAQHPEDECITIGDCEVNFNTYELRNIQGEKIPLSKREAALLKILTSTPGKVVSRDEIISRLWSPGENASSRTIDNLILTFRKHFELDPKNSKHFHSVRGVGYRYTP